MSDGRGASERMVGYYSYLFTFPSRTAMVLAVIALSAITGVLPYFMGWGGYGDINVLLYGLLGQSLPLLLSDLLVVPLFRGEAFLNPRRFTILTYASTIVYAGLILVTSILSSLTGRTDVILRGIMMAIAINAALRYLGILVFADTDTPKKMMGAFTQPALCFISASLLLPFKGTRILGLGVLAVFTVVGGVQLLLTTMRRWEGDHPGLELVPLFRAFIIAWADDLNDPLEEQITRVGEEMDLAVDSIVFEDETGGCNTALIVPYIHPGPFRNVGSSGLPAVLVERVGGDLGCEALVVHGVSTHSRDLTRGDDNDRIAEAVASNLLNNASSAHATPMAWVENNGARASCQLFGEAALVTLSLSPKSYDDLPEELGERIAEAAGGMGLNACVVDSHHSIDLDGELEEYDPNNLYEAAVQALGIARETPKSPFEVGVDRVIPVEWSFDEGMGPNGIAALVVRLEGVQTSAYIVIDGNNMVSGLREEIVEAVRARGIDEVEVMTSDTHLVNGIGATTSGYFPIGLKTDGEKVLGYALEAVGNAVSRLRGSEARHAHTVIPGLTVLGSKGLSTLSHVLESGFDLFKTAGLIISPAALLLAVSILCLL